MGFFFNYWGLIMMNRQKQSAVSPVIAVILMVAITVVLAAVLYVMVIGIVDDDTTSIKVMSATVENKPGYWKIDIVKGSLDADKLDLKLVDDSGQVMYWNGTAMSADGDIHMTSDASTVSTSDIDAYKIVWLDNNINNDLDSGDVLWFQQPIDGVGDVIPGDYQIEIYFENEVSWSKEVTV